MAKILCKTNGNASPRGKRRVYFTCHPEDFSKYFDRLCEDIFKTHDCAIFYTEDMREPIPEQDLETDLESNSLFIVPVTLRLLNKPNRAMDFDIPYAMEKHIPILPFMMESGIDAIYSRKFGELQYLDPNSTDTTEVSYPEKLKKYLESVLISDEMAKKIRAAFDAYIFLSYRKKDRHYANELMKLIHSHPECRDIAIWYDEFLTPGESFRENIEKALSKSKLFALLVTPNLLEEPNGAPNFVMAEEYPAAKKSGIDILPAEMEQTDKETLEQKYAGIPSCINPHDASFKARLLTSISKIATSANADDPMHNFLIGLAYLDGIDVEVDRQRGLELITAAAEANLPSAMEKLCDMFRDGIGVHLDYQQAAKWGQQLYTHYSRTLGEEHATTILAQYSLALIYVNMKDYDKALELFEIVYELSCKVLGKTHQDTLNALNSMAACVCDGKCDYSRAQQIFTKLYHQQCALGRKEDPQTLTTLGNLAVANNLLGNYKTALELYTELYELRCRVLGELHKETMDTMRRIACTQSNMGLHRKALKIHKQLYKLAYHLLGPGDLYTITQLGSLAGSYFALRKYKQAKSLHEKEYALWCEQLGEAHPSSIDSLYHIALCNNALKNYQEALLQCEKAYGQYCQSLGATHASTIQTLGMLGSIYKALGNREKALELYEEKYNLSNKALGLADSLTLGAMQQYVSCYGSIYTNDKATFQLEHCYILIRTVLGEKHSYTRAALKSLVHYYFQLLPSKRQTIDRAVDLQLCPLDELLQENRQELLLLLNRLAVSFLNQGKYETALHLLQKIYPLRCEALRSLPSEGLSALNRPAFFGVGLDGLLQEAPLREATYELLLCTLGASHPDTVTAFKQMAKLYSELAYQATGSIIWQKMYDLDKKICGEVHPRTQQSLKKLNEALEDEKKAEAVYAKRRFCRFCGAAYQNSQEKKCSQCGK